MGLSRSDLARDRKTITYDHPHDDGTVSSITFTFTPSKVTADALEDISERTDDGAKIHLLFCELLALALADWDVYDDDAQTVKSPTTYESLRTFPTNFLGGIIGAMKEQNGPGGAKPSSAG